jgi:cardiolipin synthase (CMP-forming)
MNVANQLTLLRIFLVPTFLGCLLYWTPERDYLISVAFVIFTLAAITDAMDGYLAKRLRIKTRIGSFLDPLADKFLLLTAYTVLTFSFHIPSPIHIPVWLTLLVIFRDLLILTGAGLIYMLNTRLDPRPNFLGKITTVVQMLTIMIVLLNLPRGLINVSFLITGLFTLISGASYIRIAAPLFANGDKTKSDTVSLAKEYVP